jgi:hypothetical protein
MLWLHWALLFILALLVSLGLYVGDWVIILVGLTVGVSAIYRFPKLQHTARAADQIGKKQKILKEFCDELRIITARQVPEFGGTFPQGMGDPPSFILVHKTEQVFLFYYQSGISLIVSVLFVHDSPDNRDALPMMFEAAFKAYFEHMQKTTNYYSNLPPPNQES